MHSRPNAPPNGRLAGIRRTASFVRCKARNVEENAMRKRAIRTLAVLVGVAGFLVAQTKIPEFPGVKPAPVYIGNPATVKPISALPIPQNPFMAPGSWGAVHDDTYASDTYFTGGPLG